MTTDPNADIELTAFSWVPEPARGLVRDMRLRWALEEIGEPYRTRLYDRRTSGPEDRIPEQPFGQVPAMVDGNIHLFESGAACLWLADRSEVLMPRDAAGRAATLSWVFGALNSVEPFILALQMVTFFNRDAPGAAEFAPTVREHLATRLGRLADALGSRDWLADRFTVADVLMITVLRQIKAGGLLDAHPALAAYVARGEARPAFGRALDAQMAEFLPL